MHDAGVGWNNRQIAESGLSPAQKSVAFFVAQKLEFGIELKCLRRAEFVHLHRVVDDQFGGLQGIDQRGIAGEHLHGIAHGGEIDHRGHSGEVLHQNAARRESDFLVRFRLAVPGCERADVLFGHTAAVFGAQQVLQENAQRKRKMLGRNALLVERIEAVDFVVVATNAESGTAAKAVHKRLPS